MGQKPISMASVSTASMPLAGKGDGDQIQPDEGREAAKSCTSWQLYHVFLWNTGTRMGLD